MKKILLQIIISIFLIWFITPQKTKAQVINPARYLANLQFDGCDFFDNGESNFPISFRFNTTQDANGDSVIDVEDNLENLVLYSINYNVYGTGRTGLPSRGPNNQRPAIYFHYVIDSVYTVYEYWLYYADNNWLNDHEHDWEKYFIYVIDTIPAYLLISTHNSYNIYAWADISSTQYHSLIGVDGGSHAMKNSSEDGVSIGYDGNIFKNNGTLLTPDSIILPWIIYSNDSNVLNCSAYIQSPDTFYYGDPSYLTNSNEWGNPNPAPWLRDEWNNPPAPIESGIISDYQDAMISCYPNHASEKIQVQSLTYKVQSLEIYNIQGQIIKRITANENSTTIDISDLSNGFYIIKVYSGKETFSLKFIKY